MFKSHNYWKMSDFTKDELARVDQEKHYDTLWVLRRSPAARSMFARLQFELTIANSARSHGKSGHLYYREVAKCLEDLSCEFMHRHLWASSRYNPYRVYTPSNFRFIQLAKDLGFETEHIDYGNKDRIKTIEGWWQV